MCRGSILNIQNMKFYVIIQLFCVAFQLADSTCPSQCICHVEERYFTGYYTKDTFINTFVVKIVDCSNGGLNNVPGDISNDTTHLYLQGNNITRIKIYNFASLKYLQVLDLRRNPIQILPSYALL